MKKLAESKFGLVICNSKPRANLRSAKGLYNPYLDSRQRLQHTCEYSALNIYAALIVSISSSLIRIRHFLLNVPPPR